MTPNRGIKKSYLRSGESDPPQYVLTRCGPLVYGAEVSWRDPVKFSFAHGGKDGVPFPVNRPAMDGTISFLRELLEATEVERSCKVDAMRRLERLSLTWSA